MERNVPANRAYRHNIQDRTSQSLSTVTYVGSAKSSYKSWSYVSVCYRTVVTRVSTLQPVPLYDKSRATTSVLTVILTVSIHTHTHTTSVLTVILTVSIHTHTHTHHVCADCDSNSEYLRARAHTHTHTTSVLTVILTVSARACTHTHTDTQTHTHTPRLCWLWF